MTIQAIRNSASYLSAWQNTNPVRFFLQYFRDSARPVRKKNLIITSWLLLLLVSPVLSSAQIRPGDLSYPNNHLKWFTLESDHFLIHFQPGSEEAARYSASIAEMIYEPVTTFYDHEPDRKVSIVLRDREDYSNGAAFFFDNKIEIWLPSIDTPFRGSHDWFHNVITHEFIHMIQLGASMRRNPAIPALYLQWLNYENVRRPDVLYGYPNGIITHPFPALGIPAWFAEGAAQYQIEGFRFDERDSHREMILREHLLTENILSLTEMSHFSSKNSLERELVYNQGFAFVSWLTENFGESVIAKLTAASAEMSKRNFNHILKSVTGSEADDLFESWIQYELNRVREELPETVQDIPETVSDNGFLHFHPQRPPDSNMTAYLSNQGRDDNRLSLIFREENPGTEKAPAGFIHPPNDSPYNYDETRFSGRFSPRAANRFSFSPDGSTVAYSRHSVNRLGENYLDLWLYSIDSSESVRLTKNGRLQDPAWHPSLPILAAIQHQNGTQNLVTADVATGDIAVLTRFSEWETLYTPVWAPDGKSLWFSRGNRSNRDIWILDIESGEMKPLLYHSGIDFRDPWPGVDGKWLYFSSDATGIFNIYRLRLEDQMIQQVTQLRGGGFMPWSDGKTLLFSEFRGNGYQISEMTIQGEMDSSLLLRMDDFIPEASVQTKLSGQLYYSAVSSISEEENNVFEIRPYSERTTGLSIFPVLRIDAYSRTYGSNFQLIRNRNAALLGKNLWRDLKLGAYLSVRDVTEQISFFGGALFGPGSQPADSFAGFFSPTRLNKLDRDLFFIVEHRGLPFIQRSWSPTVSFEVYNLTRSVKNGFTIDEFPCTSCLPVEKPIDLRYSMWEASLWFRSKLSRWSLLEAGFIRSPYSVTTERFFSEEYRQTIPGSTTEYFRGTTFSLAWITDLQQPHKHSDMFPAGLNGTIGYQIQNGRLLQSFDVEDGLLTPNYSRDINHSVQARLGIGFKTGEAGGMMVRSRFFSYLNNPDDSFYLDYTGGLGGMRSYPTYALGGNRTFFSRFSLLQPVFTRLDRQISGYSPDKLFAHLFVETANGWGGPLETGNRLKYGFGAELRLSLNSDYLFPLKLFVTSAYGLSRFDLSLPPQFITPGDSGTVTYGRQLIFYFGLTFDFDPL
ncbi:MAG: hypothetical protein EA360_07345 [Balneolaceae bacterium]|nr:MAG: hypothetical protein EA360_07345 [Balneolaceae bacterium]